MDTYLIEAAERLEQHSSACGGVGSPYMGDDDFPSRLFADEELVFGWVKSMTDPTPVDEDWLDSIGFSIGGLFATMLLPPVCEGAAIVELSISGTEGEDGWDVDLSQGLPCGDDQNCGDDQVLLTSLRLKTRGQLRRLMIGLGIPMKEQARP